MAKLKSADIFAKNLNKLLKTHSISRNEFAKRMDISSVTVDKWLAGKFIPPHETIYSIAEMFSVSPSRFFVTSEDSELTEEVLRDVMPKLVIELVSGIMNEFTTVACTYKRMNYLFSDEVFKKLLTKLSDGKKSSEIDEYISKTSTTGSSDFYDKFAHHLVSHMDENMREIKK